MLERIPNQNKKRYVIHLAVIWHSCFHELDLLLFFNFQKTESVIAMATILNHNNTLKVLVMNRPLLFSHQVWKDFHFNIKFNLPFNSLFLNPVYSKKKYVFQYFFKHLFQWNLGLLNKRLAELNSRLVWSLKKSLNPFLNLQYRYSQVVSILGWDSCVTFENWRL